MAKARQQYFADEVSIQKEAREFAIEEQLKDKIDSVEEWAQVNIIETVKVNWTALIPDVAKAVNIEVPDVIDNLSSTSTDDALSAKQWKVLYDYIQNIASRWRFLSNWNSATGLPMTNPSESPYPYKSWDYFVVSNVAWLWGTNYRPDGSSYIIWQASTVVETESVDVSDFYFYDGTNWLLLKNSGRSWAVDSALSTTSTNPVENRVITNALNNKQNILTAWSHIDITNDIVSTTGLQEELTAWENITIQDECHRNDRWPCPDWFHVPSDSDWSSLRSLRGLWLTDSEIMDYLKIPRWRHLDVNWNPNRNWYYRTNSIFSQRTENARYCIPDSINTANWIYNNSALPIRPWKDISVQPDNTWTTLYDGSSVAAWAWIFHNTTEWLISVSADWTNWVTIADKNLWATTVRNVWDTQDGTNYWSFFQWGNNYWFPRSWPVITSSTKVDTSSYSPSNQYSSSTFVSWYIWWWQVSVNRNIRWWENPSWTRCKPKISAIDTTYTAWANIQISAQNVISATDTTYTASDFDIKDLADSTWLRTTWNWKQDTLIAWTNIQIAQDWKTISATDTTYTAWDWINIDANNEISNTLPWAIVSATAPSNPTEWMVWYDTVNDALKAYNWTSWETEWTKMVVLSYGHSTWQDFLDAYEKNAIVYCKASSQSNPWSWAQTRMAFMTFVDINSSTQAIQGVEFQYYRSRSSHSTAATVLDEVYIYKLASNWTWTVTQRDTAAEPIAWTWIWLTYNASGMTISADTSVLATKTYVDEHDIVVSATAPSSPTEWMVWYDTTNDQLKVYDWTNWNVTGKEYTAGIWIWIGTAHPDNQWPCDNWFHIPTLVEISALKDIMGTFSLDWWTYREEYIHLPKAWRLDTGVSTPVQSQAWAYGRYWTCELSDAMYKNYYSARCFYFSGWMALGGNSPGVWYSVRPFADTPSVPDNTWTTVYDGSSTATNAWIFYKSSLWLISASSDWVNWITISDKNLWATTVFNHGDTLSEANCGKYYVRWNNYWFARNGTVSATTNTKVDVTGYWPWNYYSSSTIYAKSTWIYQIDSWFDPVWSPNLWWWYTQWIWVDNTTWNSISNTGVLSVNGKTGNVVLSAWDVVVSSQPNNILTSWMKIRAWTEANYTNLGTYDSNTLYLTV